MHKKQLLILLLSVVACVEARTSSSDQGRAKRVSVNKIEACLVVGSRESLGGIPGPNGWVTNCCKGLVDRTQSEYCKEPLLGGYQYICLACGDKKCDERYENRCNCPEDCK
jgi:hypothetical protein